METAVFRIVQESLTNVRKHARARSASVDVTRAGGRLLVVVSDDGTGFDQRTVPADRFGLEGIRQRTRLFGGDLLPETKEKLSGYVNLGWHLGS